MEISEVRVKLVNNPQERLKAFCSITLDNDFVVRDLKIIDGTNGTFVAMPSRKLSDRCSGCGNKNHLRARFCNECGKKLEDSRKTRRTRSKLHADIAHPINTSCRERIQSIVVEAYQEELEKSTQPGYRPVDLDEGLDSFEDDLVEEESVESEPVEAGREEAPVVASSTEASTGYEDLIADLKKEAAHRRGPVSREETRALNEETRAPSEEIRDMNNAADQDENFGIESQTDTISTESQESCDTVKTSQASEENSSTESGFGAGID